MPALKAALQNACWLIKKQSFALRPHTAALDPVYRPYKRLVSMVEESSFLLPPSILILIKVDLNEVSHKGREMEIEDEFFPATAMPDRDWWAALWPDPDAVVRSLGVEPGMVAVDLCCGDGYFTAPLARTVNGEAYGLDIDPAMLEQARSELERSGTTVLDLIRADARDLPELLPGKVDYVLIANTFHGVPEKTAMVRNVAAVLNSRGQFAVVNWHPLPRERTVVLGKPRGPRTEMRMSPDEVRLLVEPAGFTLERIVELPPFHYGAVFRVVEAAKVGGEQ